MAEIKFCGLTRPEDAQAAGAAGAAYIGVILAEGPRLVTPARAREVLGGCSSPVARVGVFGRVSIENIARAVDEAGLDVVQLHADPRPDFLRAVRQRTRAKVWAVLRVTDSLPHDAADLFDAADAVLIDAKVDGKLGGSGVPVAWSSIASELHAVRNGRRLVLAGGLRPENVARAIAALAPDVVDVSSGVESAPGIKDHDRMREFASAVAGSQERR